MNKVQSIAIAILLEGQIAWKAGAGSLVHVNSSSDSVSGGRVKESS